MARYVALLRGINVGRAKRIPMPGLRAALEGEGYADVRTLLVSGNLVLTPPRGRAGERVADDVSHVVRKNWGHEVAVVVRTVEELRGVVACCPVAEPENGSRFFVAFLSAPAQAPAPDALGDDAWWATDREIYVWAPHGMIDSPAMAHLGELRLGVDVTVRNWNTVTKLAALAER